MGLIQRSPDGPRYGGSAGQHHTDVTTRPAPAGVTNEYLPEAAMARILLSRWATKTSLLAATNNKLSSEFMGDGVPIGDTINVPVAPKWTVRSAATDTTGVPGTSGTLQFAGQPRQASYVTMSLYEPHMVDTEETMWEGIYQDPKTEREMYEDRADLLLAWVEGTIGDEMRAGYRGGIQPLNLTGGRRLASAGVDSTTHPLGRVFLRTQASFTSRGISRGMPMALLDPETNASLAEAVQNVPYNPPMGDQSYKTGAITGSGKFGWLMKETEHAGVVDYGTAWASGTQLSAAVVETENTASVDGLANGTLGADMKVEFHGVRAVNEQTGKPVQRRASFAVATPSNRTVTGGTSTFTLSPNVYSAERTLTEHRRTCDSLPANDAAVYPYGLVLTADHTTINGKKVAASFLAVKDTTYSCMVDPKLPTGIEQAIRIRNKGVGLSCFVLRYFSGDWQSFRERILARWGSKVVEPEGGFVLCGMAQE